MVCVSTYVISEDIWIIRLFFRSGSVVTRQVFNRLNLFRANSGRGYPGAHQGAPLLRNLDDYVDLSHKHTLQRLTYSCSFL